MKCKKSLFIWIAILTLCVVCAQVDAYFYNITYSCKNDICIQGEDVVWKINISNYGGQYVEYTTIDFFDSINYSKIASLDIPFNPQSDKRGNLITVQPGQSVTVNLTGKVPKANYGQSFIYYPCFTSTIRDDYIIARDDKYVATHCYNTNETMNIVGCVSDENCDRDMACKFNTCKKITCKDCQHIEGHKCVNYECCSSEQCSQGQFCANNTCLSLNCRLSQSLFNHTCISLNCAPDEFILNRTCKKLNCSEAQFAQNQSCVKLYCNENEFLGNHSCRPLACKNNEYAFSHACAQLKCQESETFANHKCSPLGCFFFQNTINHSCVNNKLAIFKLLLETIAILAIIFFFLIDFKKFKKFRGEKIETQDKNMATKK